MLGIRAGGLMWLLGEIEKGFAGFGYCYKNWAALMSNIEVPMLTRKRDDNGVLLGGRRINTKFCFGN